MKLRLLIIICLSFPLLAVARHCPHFGNCLLEHAQVQATEQKTEDQQPQPANVLPESFGKTHFIVGASTQAVKQELQMTTAADPEKKIQEPAHENFAVQAFFSPDDKLESKLIELIGQEQESMKIAVFLFTNGNIAQALLDAQKRGIKIELVTDASCLQDKFNKVTMLHDAGIKVRVYKPETTTLLGNRMHHKYIIFAKNKEGKPWLWFGSFNLTKSADLNNQEGVILLDNDRLIDQFSKQFDILKQRCLSYKKAFAPATAKIAATVAKRCKKNPKRMHGTRIIV